MRTANEEEFQKLLKYLGRRIYTEMKRQYLDQEKLAVALGISQSSVSNMINGKSSISFKKYLSAMDSLKIDLNTELSLFYNSSKGSSSASYNNPINDLLSDETRNFITDPSHMAFNGQMGLFHIIFHSTNRNEKNCIHGILNLTERNKQCIAELEIQMPNTDDKSEDHKIYTGSAVISLIQSAVYILLSNESIGELCFLVYPYRRIMRKGFSLQGTMALAATVSSGIDSRCPTVHRLFLSREKLKPQEETYILSQLLLNKLEILISKSEFDILCKSGQLSKEFIQCFEQNCEEESYYRIEDSQFKSLIRKNNEIFFDLCQLRGHSAAPKNNKINEGVINSIFRYILENS